MTSTAYLWVMDDTTTRGPGMTIHDFTTDDGVGTCVLCGSECWIVNGVPMHTDGWRDDACDPSPAQVRLVLTGAAR